ncbi:unnamed protein product [Protopolystoma xenopodis]|uniref:Uncharacterized protein n=1 Tax=Protopolystoma xenopodis TaxID=117903 RepID=A0A448WKS4_9PLAT|nr:unnamed protein product [Protopolystoma xenopodis]
MQFFVHRRTTSISACRSILSSRITLISPILAAFGRLKSRDIDVAYPFKFWIDPSCPPKKPLTVATGGRVLTFHLFVWMTSLGDERRGQVSMNFLIS